MWPNCCHFQISSCLIMKEILFYHLGRLSKAKGLMLRVAGVVHVLFQFESPGAIPTENL